MYSLKHSQMCFQGTYQTYYQCLQIISKLMVLLGCIFPWRRRLSGMFEADHDVTNALSTWLSLEVGRGDMPDNMLVWHFWWGNNLPTFLCRIDYDGILELLNYSIICFAEITRITVLLTICGVFQLNLNCRGLVRI
jgi:hypothetical protein